MNIMRKFLLLILFISAVSAILAQPCSELFISEYVEGSNNNKALEIYNPTNQDVDLSDYQLSRYSNGGTSPNYVGLSGTLAPYDVIIIVLDKQDCSKSGQDTCVFEELRGKADLFLCPVYEENKMFYFNGNDAVTLETKLGIVVDLIGKVGENPGQAWTDSVEAGCVDPEGTMWWKHWTKDQTLIRKKEITEGVKENPTGMFNPSVEWDSLPRNTFSELGYHDCDCNPQTSISTVSKRTNDAFCYPNIVKNNQFVVKATSVISEVEVVNVIGQPIFKHKSTSGRGDMKVNLPSGTKGMYLVRIKLIDNTSLVKKILVY